jgi:hypothetical protein
MQLYPGGLSNKLITFVFLKSEIIKLGRYIFSQQFGARKHVIGPNMQGFVPSPACMCAALPLCMQQYVGFHALHDADLCIVFNES